MARTPPAVHTFLSGKRFAVIGVSRKGGHVGNGILRRLKANGYEVFPINPNATEVEGIRCYPDIASVPVQLDGVVVASHPSHSAQIVRDCAESNVRWIWLHRSFGQGSVSSEALSEAGSLGIGCIEGGCPLMYCEPVDIGHKCMRWFLGWRGRVPGE